MLTFVTWKWATPGYRSTFGPATVNTMRAMIARHYAAPHRFLCVTDDRDGLDPRVEAVEPWHDFEDVPSPHGPRYPSCYRRLRAFAPDIAQTFGPRFVVLDLDGVITGDLSPLFDRPEDAVLWADPERPTQYNGSLLLLTAGARSQVWTQFDPATSPARAKAAGCLGSDQGWISYCLGPGEATWTDQHGVCSYARHISPTGERLPAGTRAVFFHGAIDPWSMQALAHPWVREHYSEARP